MYGKDYKYAATRITETIVIKDGDPVFVHDVSRSNGTVMYSDFKGTGTQAAHISEFDLSTPTLGMFEVGSNCLYLSRVPLRRDWRQGLRRHNCQVIWSSSGHVGGVDTKNIAACISYPYRDIKKAMRRAKVHGKVTPFHHSWAVGYCEDEGYKLYYKWFGVVGHIDEHLQPVFEDKYALLTQSLEEVLA